MSDIVRELRAAAEPYKSFPKAVAALVTAAFDRGATQVKVVISSEASAARSSRSSSALCACRSRPSSRVHSCPPRTASVSTSSPNHLREFRRDLPGRRSGLLGSGRKGKSDARHGRPLSGRDPSRVPHRGRHGPGDHAGHQGSLLIFLCKSGEDDPCHR